MKRILLAIYLIHLFGPASIAFGYDPCQMFFWTQTRKINFSGDYPYRIEFVNGIIPQDSGLADINGRVIKDRWSRQAEKCLLSTSSYGIFTNPIYLRGTFASRIEKALEVYDYAQSQA